MTRDDPTGPVRRAMEEAHREAIGFGHDYVGTEHMLLGLMRDPSIAATLQGLGVSPEDVREAIERTVRRGTARPKGELPYTSRATKVIELALAEARQANVADVQPRHVLLGLLLEERGIACEVLNQLGVTAEKVRPSGAE